MATVDSPKGFIAQLFSFSGRATVKDFWWTVLKLFGIEVVISVVFSLGMFLFEGSVMGGIWSFIFGLVWLAALVPFIANFFRRLHDLGLSGYWTFYLSFAGIPCVFCAYAMDADESAKGLVERIKSLGRIWGWILAILLWPAGSVFASLLVAFAKGQNADNAYGPNPYAPVAE